VPAFGSLHRFPGHGRPVLRPVVTERKHHNGKHHGRELCRAGGADCGAELTLAPYTMIASGVATNGTVTLNQPAPAGGVMLNLSSSDAKIAKTPATVLVPAGSSTATLAIQASGVNTPTAVTITRHAAYPDGHVVEINAVTEGHGDQHQSAGDSHAVACIGQRAPGNVYKPGRRQFQYSGFVH
jgi:hypothetical protein